MTRPLDKTIELSYARLAEVGRWRDLQAAAHLSDREVQVAILLLRGRTCRAIAAELKISAQSVHTYGKRLHRKLDVANRAALILKLMLASGLLLEENPPAACPPNGGQDREK